MNDRESALTAVQRNGQALLRAEVALKSDSEAALTTTQHRELEYADGALRHDREMGWRLSSRMATRFSTRKNALKSDSEAALVARLSMQKFSCYATAS